MTDPYPVKDWVDELNKGIAQLGGDIFGASKLSRQMQDAGRINVEETVLKLPLGIWPKDKLLKRAGMGWRVAISDGLTNICSRVFTRGLGRTIEEVDVYLVGFGKVCMMHRSMFISHCISLLGRNAKWTEKSWNASKNLPVQKSNGGNSSRVRDDIEKTSRTSMFYLIE
jgi:hypothetical protein